MHQGDVQDDHAREDKFKNGTVDGGMMNTTVAMVSVRVNFAIMKRALYGYILELWSAEASEDS